MKTYSIQDKYNPSKLWIVKVYNTGGVFYNQEIAGQKVNSRFQKTTKAWINQILDTNLNERLSDEEQELLDKEEHMGSDGTWHLCDEYENKDRYVELFTKIHESEFNPYLNDEDDDFVKPEDAF